MLYFPQCLCFNAKSAIKLKLRTLETKILLLTCYFYHLYDHLKLRGSKFSLYLFLSIYATKPNIENFRNRTRLRYVNGFIASVLNEHLYFHRKFGRP